MEHFESTSFPEPAPVLTSRLYEHELIVVRGEPDERLFRDLQGCYTGDTYAR
jgi:hypothetical protein